MAKASSIMRSILGITLISLMMSTLSLAETEPSPRPKDQTIPQQPSAPPALQESKPPTAALSCQRKFMYQGKQLDCDSIMHRDGEGLRPIISSVPAAVSELDTYQKNRQSVKKSAYLGSFGLAMALAGVLTHSQADTSIAVRNALVGGGFLITGGSLIYGLTVLGANESHLINAVDYYNQAKPRDPIDIEFSTQLHF